MSVQRIRRLGRRVSRTLNRFRSSALILLYHRVADLATDPFEQAISPRRFEEHLEVLVRRAQPVGLTELLKRLSTGKIAQRSAVVTFDDGYADNLHAAAPILQKHGVPATFFLSTGPIQTG